MTRGVLPGLEPLGPRPRSPSWTSTAGCRAGPAGGLSCSSAALWAADAAWICEVGPDLGSGRPGSGAGGRFWKAKPSAIASDGRESVDPEDPRRLAVEIAKPDQVELEERRRSQHIQCSHRVRV